MKTKKLFLPLLAASLLTGLVACDGTIVISSTSTSSKTETTSSSEATSSQTTSQTTSSESLTTVSSSETSSSSSSTSTGTDTVTAQEAIDRLKEVVIDAKSYSWTINSLTVQGRTDPIKGVLNREKGYYSPAVISYGENYYVNDGLTGYLDRTFGSDKDELTAAFNYEIIDGVVQVKQAAYYQTMGGVYYVPSTFYDSLSWLYEYDPSTDEPTGEIDLTADELTLETDGSFTTTNEWVIQTILEFSIVYNDDTYLDLIDGARIAIDTEGNINLSLVPNETGKYIIPEEATLITLADIGTASIPEVDAFLAEDKALTQGVDANVASLLAATQNYEVTTTAYQILDGETNNLFQNHVEVSEDQALIQALAPNDDGVMEVTDQVNYLYADQTAYQYVNDAVTGQAGFTPVMENVTSWVSFVTQTIGQYSLAPYAMFYDTDFYKAEGDTAYTYVGINADYIAALAFGGYMDESVGQYPDIGTLTVNADGSITIDFHSVVGYTAAGQSLVSGVTYTYSVLEDGAEEEWTPTAPDTSLADPTFTETYITGKLDGTAQVSADITVEYTILTPETVTYKAYYIPEDGIGVIYDEEYDQYSIYADITVNGEELMTMFYLIPGDVEGEYVVATDDGSVYAYYGDAWQGLNLFNISGQALIPNSDKTVYTMNTDFSGFESGLPMFTGFEDYGTLTDLTINADGTHLTSYVATYTGSMVSCENTVTLKYGEDAEALDETIRTLINENVAYIESLFAQQQ